MGSERQSVAIPLCGKMAFRSFHTAEFMRQLNGCAVEPVYFIEPEYFSDGMDSRYERFSVEKYESLYSRPFLRLCSELRRVWLATETIDQRVRDMFHELAFSKKSVAKVLLFLSSLNAARSLRPLAPAVLALEQAVARTVEHTRALKDRGISSVLTPGMGSYGFLWEGLLAREAHRIGLRTVSAISNYDNVVNRGYMGYMPDVLAVWSEQMAADAVRYLGFPARRIAVTGPVQFDRYAGDPCVSRDEFLRSKGLDPAKKTVFYAGSVMATQYFEFLRFVTTYLAPGGKNRSYNIVVRPIPHNKLLSWYGMDIFRDAFRTIDNTYYSDPRSFSSDTFAPVAGATPDAELDELHCLFRYSDVMINTYSTVALEAAVNDLPTVHLGYENFTFANKYPSYPRFQALMTHNKRPLRLAAAKTAKDDADLMRCIESYLTDRSADRDARRAYAVSECGTVDGKAGERLAFCVRGKS
jgi:hypothetical protein